jgi:hypothetical protein
LPFNHHVSRIARSWRDQCNAFRLTGLDKLVAKACEMVCDEAKLVIGEGYSYWPALKPETLARKMMATPLLQTGELRASIDYTISADGLEGQVGSNSDKAVWHVRIPDRSFLMGAAVQMEEKIHKPSGSRAFAGELLADEGVKRQRWTLRARGQVETTLTSLVPGRGQCALGVRYGVRFGRNLAFEQDVFERDSHFKTCRSIP